jgi:hypothetical protein
VWQAAAAPARSAVVVSPRLICQVSAATGLDHRWRLSYTLHTEAVLIAAERMGVRESNERDVQRSSEVQLKRLHMLPYVVSVHLNA